MFCETNSCDKLECHRCFPRHFCDEHDKCKSGKDDAFFTPYYTAGEIDDLLMLLESTSTLRTTKEWMSFALKVGKMRAAFNEMHGVG